MDDDAAASGTRPTPLLRATRPSRKLFWTGRKPRSKVRRVALHHVYEVNEYLLGITRMEHVLNRVVNEAGRLLRADETRFAGSGGFVTCVTLTFEHLMTHISAVADDDTISVSLDSPPNDNHCVTVAATDQSPWVGLYGFECRWAWLLTNQQGYTDGVRLEFFDDTRSRVVEMIVAASQIQYYEFTNDANHAPQ